MGSYSEKLLPCSCNGEGIISEDEYYTDCKNRSTLINKYGVECDFCYARTPFVASKEVAIASWNAMMKAIKGQTEEAPNDTQAS